MHVNVYEWSHTCGVIYTLSIRFLQCAQDKNSLTVKIHNQHMHHPAFSCRLHCSNQLPCVRLFWDTGLNEIAPLFSDHILALGDWHCEIGVKGELLFTVYCSCGLGRRSYVCAQSDALSSWAICCRSGQCIYGMYIVNRGISRSLQSTLSLAYPCKH